ncbi:hypothetical protein D0860_02643 [Hortaea werneckii]|uniref:Cyanovirin-N domain-containing protein n=1 Tax=Hortaea werneckii TaxID=91943 RepID=A0A3M7HJ58_HORWE|nr:hypothetical protein D0860_02643 [Hortaea werneckii]RMZ33402.1 hypothetical protein D0859_02456 [Hortaea werneckii]
MGFLHALAIIAGLTLTSIVSAALVAAQSSVRANKVPKKLHCFNVCYGAKRTIFEQTIHNFCASYDGKIHMEMLAQHDESCTTQIVPCNCCKEDGKEGGIWHGPWLLLIYSPAWDGCIGS